jgi:hypothetical protein
MTPAPAIPDSLPLDLVDLGQRGRTTYDNIDELAESIRQVGLINPIVLEPQPDGRWLVRAGGRRLHAIKDLGLTTLFHSVSSDPDRPGFLVANVAADELRGLLIELAENHDREDIAWMDDLKLIHRAFSLWERERHAAGEVALARQFGALSKVKFQDIAYIKIIYDDVVARPERYAECASLRAAYRTFLKITAEELAKVAATKSLTKIPLERPVVVANQSELPFDQPEESPPLIVEVSKTVLHTNGIDFLDSCEPETFDHIVTDPDYAVDLGRLEANSSSAAEGVYQSSVESSLGDLERFLSVAFRVTRSFCVFWYDLDHHEKLQRLATAIGWRVQRWPLIWHKTDFRSNGAPQHNFCKNIEYAMVLRKPSAVLSRVQTSSLFSTSGTAAQREFGHPFAKPRDLWTWIYTAIAIKGQSVIDPFAGRGSAPTAALLYGLRPFACEINDAHYPDLVLNMQAYYRKVLSTNIKFE